MSLRRKLTRFSDPGLAPFAGAAVLLSVLWLVSVPSAPLFDACGFHRLTGRPCPLCGLTRGLFALAKGHFVEAEHFNALTPVGFAMVFSLFWEGPWRAWLWRLGIAAFAIYGVIRLAAS